MGATTMRSISSLIHKLKTDYPEVSFVKGDVFAWSPETQTVFYNNDVPHASALLLHEVSHSILEHSQYRRDVELLALETAAWDKAYELAREYHIALNTDTAEDNLDTYRDWLHARSTCPECTANGYQIDQHHYQCPACTTVWKVNEARICALRRHTVTGVAQ